LPEGHEHFSLPAPARHRLRLRRGGRVSAAKKKDESSLCAPCPVRYFDNTVAHNVYSLPHEDKVRWNYLFYLTG